ncbi:MAG: HEAT repeat domain-containing protein [Planctomycetes bacterium]|nr:HEAT repeat domain-containing protein [Planctomycetota bacterium]
MTRAAAVFTLLLVAAACGRARPDADARPTAPPLPPLQLRPFLPALERLAATLPPPDAAAQRELRELGDVALRLLEADPRTQMRADRALLEHGDAWWVLEPALLHDDVAVRTRAAWLCGQSAQPALQAALVLRLKYELDPNGVLWVADALQRLGNDVGLGWLDAAMGRDDTAQQAGTMAIDICRERGLPLSEPPTYDELRAHMRALYDAWRRTGTSSRAGVPPAPQALLDARFAAHLKTTQGTQLRPVDDARFVTTRCGRLPLPLLVRTLSAEEPYLRTMALQVLADIGAPAREAAPAVLPLLADPLTGSYAVRTLGEIGATDAVPHLRPRLADPDTEQRAAAAQALGLLQDRPSAADLTTHLLDPQEAIDVRVGAAFGLLCLGENAAAEAFLAERQRLHDYHEPTLQRLRERLAQIRR